MWLSVRAKYGATHARFAPHRRRVRHARAGVGGGGRAAEQMDCDNIWIARAMDADNTHFQTAYARPVQPGAPSVPFRADDSSSFGGSLSFTYDKWTTAPVSGGGARVLLARASFA
jgi:hypothetical protein